MYRNKEAGAIVMAAIKNNWQQMSNNIQESDQSRNMKLCIDSGTMNLFKDLLIPMALMFLIKI